MVDLKKYFTIFFLLVFIALGNFSQAYASESSIDDQASLFTEEQISELNAQITPIETKTKASVFIVTTNDNSTDPTKYADYYMLDRIGKNQNGITFYIDMKQRKFIVSTSGNMIDYMTDARIDAMNDLIGTEMGNGNYFSSAETFLNETSTYFDQGVPSNHYRVDADTGKVTYYKSLTQTEILIAILGALAISILFFILIVSKYKLKFGQYTYPFKEKSSLQLSTKRDTLVNSFTTTRRIPRNNSNHGSGGGFGGGGGSTTHNTGGGTFGGGGRSF